MATSTNKGGRKGGPDLLARAAAQEGNRILSQLEHGAAPLARPALALPWQPGWLGMVGAVLGTMLLVLAWLAWDSGSGEPPVPRTAGAAAPVPAPAATSQASEPPAPAPAAATIINEAPAAAAPPAARTLPHKSQAARTPAARSPNRQHSAPAGDSDVTLLAAMVAHRQRVEPAPAEPAPAEPVPVRDVVLRQNEDETSALLQRCRQLGLIEGMLCRARICSGRWNSDPACH